MHLADDINDALKHGGGTSLAAQRALKAVFPLGVVVVLQKSH